MRQADRRYLSRRNFLRLLLAAGGGALVSCNLPSAFSALPSPSATGSPFLNTLFPFSDSPTQPSSTPRPASATPSPSQTATQTATETPSPTATASDTPSPVPVGNKINTVVVLNQENHSYDNLFAAYPGGDGEAARQECPEAVTEPIEESGQAGFVFFCSYNAGQVPNYWEMARNFALCDHFFSAVKAPSFPNYFMMMTGESPIMSNPPPPYACPSYCFDVPSIANRLDEAGLSWRDYGGMLANIQALMGRREIVTGGLEDFFNDAAAGSLQNVVWINPYLLGGVAESGHPPGSICVAENYAVQIFNALLSSPQWGSCLFILTWDEWGGFYDHLEAPVVERLADGRVFRYGPRVPALVISPYARQGYVSHTEYSHVSILKTIEQVYNLAALTGRDRQANGLLDCCNFGQAPVAPFSLALRACQ